MSEEVFARAVRLHEAGDFVAAEALYRCVIAADPDNANALYLHGTVLLQLGDPDAARGPLARAAGLAPSHGPIWSNLAVAAEACGDVDGTLSAIEQLLQLEPGNAEARAVAARLRLDLAEERAAAGDVEDALALLQPVRASGALEPGQAALAALSAATILAAAGRLEDARAAAVQATDLAPTVETWLVRAELDLALRQPQLALHAAEAALLESDSVDAGIARATALAALGRMGEARAGFTALARRTDDPVLALRAALTIDPVPADGAAIAVVRADRLVALDRLEADPPALADPESEIQQPMMPFAYHGQDERPVLERYARLLARCCPDLAATPRLGPRRKQLRVAMVSAFFGHHTITKLNRSLIAGLSQRGVEVVLVRWPGPLDGGWHDLARLAHATVTLPQRLDRARAAVVEIDADIVHYPELGMHLPTQLLAMARLGRVQTVGWGHPVTTGLSSLDAMLSVAAMEPDGAAAHYTEPLIGLPGPGVAFARPEIPALPPLDLPSGRRYVCPQSLFKLHPEFDAVLGQLLAADPAAQLILIAGEHASWGDALGARLARVLDAQRVTILPRLDQARFFSLLAAADVMLDVPQWSGGTSTLEALALGTPIVTWPGEFMRGRHTAALLSEAGLKDHIATSADAYVAIAQRLAAAGNRHQIQQAAAGLFDRPEPIDATLAHWQQLLDRQR